MKTTLTTLLAAALLLGCGAKDAPDAPDAPAAGAAPQAAESPAAPASTDPAAALRDPSLATATAPATYRVRFETTAGDFVVAVHRDWAPNGADRFYNLVRADYFTDVAFFRVIDQFMAQFGIHGDPEVARAWLSARIPDDEVKQSNTRGRLSFATAGPNTRTTQLFINKVDNPMLDGMGFSPFGEVVEGMAVVDALHAGYGEGAPRGRGPDQGRLQSAGNAYLREGFPELDYVKHATIVAD